MGAACQYDRSSDFSNSNLIARLIQKKIYKFGRIFEELLLIKQTIIKIYDILHNFFER